MTRLRPIGALAVLLALASGSVAAAAQQTPTRPSDQQVKDLMSRIHKRTDTFRSSFNRAIDRNPINGSREEDQINQSVKDFEQSTDRLRDRVNDHQSGTANVEEVLGRAFLIDSFMRRNRLDASAEDDWLDLRQDLDELAHVYGVTWNWAFSRNMPARADDKQVEQLLKRIEKGADQFRKSLDEALDESSRDSSTAEDDINQFVAEFAETTDHLKDPFGRNHVVTNDIEDVLRRGASIDAFMQRHRLNEQAQNDWLRLRRDLDDLARVYHVAWSWSDLQYSPGGVGTELYRLSGTYQQLAQPVIVASSYRKSWNQAAEWDVYTWILGDVSNADSEVRHRAVPSGTRLVTTLNDDLSTHNARRGDRLTATIRSPSQYQDAVILGFVTRVNGRGRRSGRSEMSLVLQSIRLRDGSSHDFDGVIESIRTPDGETIAVHDEGTIERVSRTEETVQRGTIGAGTVILEGRDRLELQRGTEVTILSGASGSRRLTTNLGR